MRTFPGSSGDSRNWNGGNLNATARGAAGLGLIAGLACWLAVAIAPAVADEEAWRRFRGQVVVSDVLLASSFGSDRIMITSLNRVRSSAVGQVSGFWRLHFVAFLDPAAEGDVLRVAVRDVTTAENRREARLRTLAPVRVFEVPAQPDQKILHMNDWVLTQAMGFLRGHDYEVAVEKDPDKSGKSDVHARGVVTLR